MTEKKPTIRSIRRRPKTLGGSLECPVRGLASHTLASARSLTHMLRLLRRSMGRCGACPVCAGCPLLIDFNTQLTIALQELADEWRLESRD